MLSPATLGALAGKRLTRAQMTVLAKGATKQSGIPVALILAVAYAESGWYTKAKSSAGAMGLMQLIPATAKNRETVNWVGKAPKGDYYNPAWNVKAGASYLRFVWRREKAGTFPVSAGDAVKNMLVSYVAGPGRRDKWKGYAGAPTKVKAYVDKVLGRYVIYGGKLKGKAVTPKPLPVPKPKPIVASTTGTTTRDKTGNGNGGSGGLIFLLILGALALG